MKILVIGGGGREHALCWSLRQSPEVTEVVCAPGNAGIAAIARCVPVEQTSLLDMRRVVHAVSPELVVIGPEVPLAAGIVDALSAEGFRVFGPTEAAARLESSKSFAKHFMQRQGIPTAQYAVCRTLAEVEAALPHFSAPIVVKADGLAAGKGVVIAQTPQEAEAAAENLLDLGGPVVLEEFLEGTELSFFALCDGRTALPIAAAQDHKRLLDGDRGPNTGGMGACCTDDLLPPELRESLRRNVAQRVVDGMRGDGTPFRGILFCGIMMTAHGPEVLEFNTRWGDPEMEAIALRLQTPMLDLFNASIDGNAHRLQIRLRPGAAVSVIAASANYPGPVRKGVVIHGLNAKLPPETVIFHSGTETKGRDTVTSGGRVLAASAAAPTLPEALARAYAAMDEIYFEGMQFRRDIGHRALPAKL